MTVIVLANCPQGLRGFLTRWLLEISAGVFIGNPSSRVRDVLWREIQQHVGQGRALLVHTSNNEQGYVFRTHDHAWQPVDHEGLTLIHRPASQATTPDRTDKRPGWSKASKRRRFQKP